MAEQMPQVEGLDRAGIYEAVERTARAVLEGEDDRVARMSTLACLVHHALGNLWTGFYRVVRPGLLKVGPYQGTLGCLEISVGRGVCGAAALRRETVIVPDVSRFPGHIACDSRSRSEIVVPVFDGAGELIAVFDLDSEQLGAFDAVDREGLERLAGLVAGAGSGAANVGGAVSRRS